MDMNSENWGQNPPLPDEGELKKMRRNLEKRNWKLVLTSVVLAAAILLGTVNCAIPYAESLYWNPDEITYVGTSKDTRTDLWATVQAYTELFHPGYEALNIEYVHTGFAGYDLDICLAPSAAGPDQLLTISGSMEKNRLSLGHEFSFVSGNYAFSHRREAGDMPDDFKKTLCDKLAAMPDYICLEACLTFSQDLSMRDLMTFYRNNPDLTITWAAIRSAPVSPDWTPLCGMDPFTGGLVYSGINRDYPSFNLSYFNPEGDGTALEEHFKSLLQYSDDQLEKGRGIPYENQEGFYRSALDYVNENGVYSYGCVVHTSPQKLLELLDSGTLHSIYLVDGWIDVS